MSSGEPMTDHTAGQREPSAPSRGSLFFTTARNTGDEIFLSQEDKDVADMGMKVSYVGKVFVGVHEHRRAVASIVAERKIGRALTSHEAIAFRDRNRRNLSRENVLVVSVPTRARYSGPQRGTSSRYKGVSWQEGRKKWYAQIKIDGRSKYLGRYDREEDAAAAYDKAVQTLGIDIAYMNLDQ